MHITLNGRNRMKDSRVEVKTRGFELSLEELNIFEAVITSLRDSSYIL